MKKLLLICMMLLLITGCSSKVANGKVTCNQKDIVLENENAILVDVREKDEYDERHLDNAINAPYTKVVELLKDYDKDTPIIVYCRSGNRSAKAYQSLQDAGYTNLYDLGAMSNC